MKPLLTPLLILSTLIPAAARAQSVAIEHKKMNVFYIGVENPLKIVVESYSCDKVVVKAKGGVVKPSSENCGYTYRIDSCMAFSEQVYVGVMENNTIKWLDTLDYRLKRMPDPVIVIAGHWSGMVKKEQFIKSSIIAELQNFQFDGYARVLSYSWEMRRDNMVIAGETAIQGNNFTEVLKSEISKAQAGDKFYFFDVYTETSIDGCVRVVQPAKFEIN